MEILTVHYFITGDSVRNEVPLEEATLAVCTTDGCGLALPMELDRLPKDVKKGDEFIWVAASTAKTRTFVRAPEYVSASGDSEKVIRITRRVIKRLIGDVEHRSRWNASWTRSVISLR